MTRETKQTTPGYGTLITGNPNFRNLWLGQIISLLGDWFNLIASATLVAALTESELAVGALFVVRMLAPFLISPLAGVAADRYNRKKLLIATDVIRAVAVLGFLWVRDTDDVWLLYTLTAIQLAFSGVFYPARNAILPDIVKPSELGAANALSSATWSVMLALGAALGGLVSGTWGIYPAFVIDAGTFLVSAGVIGLIRYQRPGQREASDAGVSSAFREYVEGLQYLARHRDVLVISLQKAVMSISMSGAFQVIQVALAEQVFVIGKGGALSLGIIFGVVGLGTGLGPILSRRFTGDHDRSLRIGIGVSFAVGSLGLVIVAPIASFEMVLLGTLIRSFGIGVIWVFSTQLLLQLVPGEFRGRVFSMEFAFLTLANAAGAALGGWALDNTSLGLSGLTWSMVGLSVVSGLGWTTWLAVRANRSIGRVENG
jgi:MFS family permease